MFYGRQVAILVALPLGRVTSVDNNGTSGVPRVILASAYDSASNRTSLSATVAGTADFLNTSTFDALNRLTRLDQTGQSGGNTVAEKRVDFSYNGLGQFTAIARYKDTDGGSTHEVATSAYTFDTLNRLTGLSYKKGGTDLFTAYSFSYDTLGRITSTTNQDGTTAYTYDKTSQLTAADHSYQTDESYSFDANGNRTMTGYTTGSNNRLTSDGTYNYSYDNEGNRTLRTKISDGSKTEYEWDYRNRLIRITEKTSGGTVTKESLYKYDEFDRRISKSVDPDGPGATAATVSRYIYDGDNIVLVYSGAGSLTNRYLHGPAVDQILADEQIGGSLLFPLADNQGTIRDLVNTSGVVQNHIKFESFGKITAESNAAVDHLFGYTGRERDEESSLQFHRARYLDPLSGRWLSHDLIGFHASDPNLLRYVTNDPVNQRDSSGLNPNQEDATWPEHLLLFVQYLEEEYAVHNGGQLPDYHTGIELLADYQNDNHHIYIYSELYDRWIDMRHFANSADLYDHWYMPFWMAITLTSQFEHLQALPFVSADSSASAYGVEDEFSNIAGISAMMEWNRRDEPLRLSVLLKDWMDRIQVINHHNAPSYPFLPPDELTWQSWYHNGTLIAPMNGAMVHVTTPPPLVGNIEPYEPFPLMPKGGPSSTQSFTSQIPIFYSESNPSPRP